MFSQSRVTLGELGNCVSMAAPTNSGESDIAIGQVDETIYFNFPPSPPYFPPLSLPCFPPSSPYYPPLSPPCFPPSPPYSPPFSLPQNFRPSSNSMVVHQQRSNQSTENPPQDLLRLYEDMSDAGTSTFPPSPPPPPFPPSSNTMAVHPPENLLLYEDVSNTCLTTFPPSPPPPFLPLSNSMFVYPRSEQSMGRPPQNLQYEDIIDTSRNLDEDLSHVKVFAAFCMNIFNGTNKLYVGVGQGHALNGTNRLYIGVGQGRGPHGGKWVAKIRIQRKLVSVGRFNCPEDAAIARDLLAFMLTGDKARLNFPEHLEVIKRKAEILQQLPLTAHEENPDEDSDEVEDEDSDSNEIPEAESTENQLQNLQQSGKQMVVGFMSDNFNENSPENQQHERIIGASWYFYGKSALWKKKVLLCMNDAFNFMSREELMTILMSEDSVRNDFLFIEMRRRDCSKWESKIRLGWNWLSIGTFNAVVLASEGAIFKLREDKARLSSPKLFLIFGPCPFSPYCYTCPYHSPIIPRLLQLLRTAQRETPDEFYGIEIGGEGTGCPGHSMKIPRLLQLPPTAQRETPYEYFGIEIGGEGTGEGVMEEAHLNFRSSRKEKRKGKDQGGDQRGKKKIPGVRIAITLEDILQTREMRLKDAAKHLNVSITRLKSICREYGIPRWPPRNERKLSRQSLLSETRAVVDQEGIPQLTSHCNQVLTATTVTNSVVEKEILLPQLLPIAQLEKPDVCFDNDEAEAIAIGVEGTEEGVMEEPQLNSGCSRKGKWKEKSLGGDRGHDKTTGVRISISKEHILETKGMRLIDAAKHLEVSRSTFKRACREYGIERWPPRKEHELISQSHPNEPPAVVDQEQISHPNEPPAVVDQEKISHPNEPPAVVDQEQIPQLNSDILLPSDQVLATIGTNNVTIMARYAEVRIKFRLSWPWRMVELEQQVKKRLPLEAGTYYIKYKDEDDGLTLIACDEDLEDFISSSSPLGTHSIEVFLEPKVAHELCVNQL